MTGETLDNIPNGVVNDGDIIQAMEAQFAPPLPPIARTVFEVLGDSAMATVGGVGRKPGTTEFWSAIAQAMEKDGDDDRSE